MSTPREELHALIDSLPEQAAADLLAEVRLFRLRATDKQPGKKSSEAWPPAWFGSVEGSRPDFSEHIDDILRAEFGRPSA
jgi:hypothetical protein